MSELEPPGEWKRAEQRLDLRALREIAWEYLPWSLCVELEKAGTPRGFFAAVRDWMEAQGWKA